jgi:hypothetical protein
MLTFKSCRKIVSHKGSRENLFKWIKENLVQRKCEKKSKDRIQQKKKKNLSDEGFRLYFWIVKLL